MSTDTAKLPLGGPAWLRAIADDKEEMLNALGAVDEDARKEEQREIQGLRDAAKRMETGESLIEAAIKWGASHGWGKKAREFLES